MRGGLIHDTTGNARQELGERRMDCEALSYAY